MRVIASYILKGPLQAAMAAGLSAIVSVSAPFVLKLLLIYFCGVVIALVTLRLGGRKGLLVLSIAVAAAILAGQMLQINAQIRLDLWNSVYLWVLVWVCAGILYARRSLILTLEVAGLVGVITIVLFFTMVENPLQLSRGLLEPMRPLLSQPQSGLSRAEIDKMLGGAANILAGSIEAYTVMGALISLLIARSWQARLFNPGGLQLEFRTLRVGKKVGWLTLAGIVAMYFASSLGVQLSLILLNISIVIGLLYVIVGLGVVHGLLALRENPGFWLVGLYALLIILSKLMIPVLMTLALSDVWLNYRNRFARS